MRVKRARCSKWMPKVKEACALPAGHTGRCRSTAAAKAHTVRTTARNKRVASARKAAIDAWKLDRGCEICGYRGSAVALDLDHMHPLSKAGDVSQLQRYASWEKVVAELAKCRVLCANCHRVHTFTALL